MYYSETNRPPRGKFAEGGFKKTVDVYEDLINEKTGKLETKKTREEPFYKRMQEETESQLLETLIERYKVDLNKKHITQLKEELVDMVGMPADLIETYALTHKLEKQFNESTADIKAHFKDFAGYLRAFQEGTLGQDLNNIIRKRKVVQQPVQQQTVQQQPVQQPVQQKPVQQPVQQPTQPGVLPGQTTMLNNGGVYNGQ